LLLTDHGRQHTNLNMAARKIMIASESMMGERDVPLEHRPSL
jgi:hypothetical protein